MEYEYSMLVLHAAAVAGPPGVCGAAERHIPFSPETESMRMWSLLGTADSSVLRVLRVLRHIISGAAIGIISLVRANDARVLEGVCR